MTDKAYAVPLYEQLANVPRNARLVIDDADGMGTRFIPVGRMCHEAAEALRARLAQPEPSKELKGDDLERAFYRDWEAGKVRRVSDGKRMVPEREWVGLTDEEIEGAIDDGFAFGLDDGNVSNEYVIRYVRAIEAKLREKNG